MVFDKRASSLQPHFTMAGTGHGRAPVRCADTRSSDEMSAATDARPAGIPQRLRRAFHEQISQGESIRVDRSRRRKSCDLRACRIADKHIRWQLELAWTSLDADQLFADRVAAE